jgi:Ca-activated chloride channel family protein
MTDRTLIRQRGSSIRYVLLSFAAPEAARASVREPVNVAFVIDRSGSMDGSKIALARDAIVQALAMLRPTGRFAVVSYDNEIDVLVPSTLATREAIGNAIEQVRLLQARGSTDLGGGWLRGCEEIARHQKNGQVARSILLSDGLANHGITDLEELARNAGRLRARGITTSTIGLGADFDERMLEGLSTAGAGHFYYVETPVQIPDCLTSELGEALEIVARDVAVTIQTTDGVAVETLNRFPVHNDAHARVFVRLGDLASRQEVSIVLRLTFPAGEEGKTARAIFGVTDANGAIREPDTDVIWTFADDHANDAQARKVVVDRAVARLYAARAKAEALELNSAGRFEEAGARLEATARRILRYAGRDPELLAIAGELRERRHAYANAMSAMASKAEHYASMNVARMRDPGGKAHRRPKP